MKFFYLFFVMALTACNQSSQNNGADLNADSAEQSAGPAVGNREADSLQAKTYSNQRFRNVTVQKVKENTYTIEGEGQIFEANFGWVVEDGHNEIQEGHQMTDAGAPEWGKFSFTIEVQKPSPNASLTLILFETSAKDGSRVHELAVPLGAVVGNR
jgi:hypothetical protein